MKKLLLYFIVFVTMQTISAQTNEVLTNKIIIDLNKAGLSKEIVISKIETTVSKFDLTTTGLIALKKQGISDAIINAMMNKANDINHNTATVPSNAGKALKNPFKGKVDVELLNYVYTYYNDTVTPLEKTLANLKTKSKAFGYGGVNSVLEIEGAASSIKLSPSNTSAFVIKTGGETAPDIVLYKLKTTGKKRQAVTGKYTMMGMQGSEGAITVNISVLDNGIFKISPSKSLDKGEYFFLNRSISNAGTNSEVFAFTVN